jgi:hypothetical protein
MRFAMKSLILVAGLLSMLSIGSAKTWSGVLVDGKCLARLRDNPSATLPFVDRDTEWMVRYCTPSKRTGCFDIVPTDGGTLRLDKHGNAEAWALVRKLGRRRLVQVEVAGVKKGQNIAVTTMKVTRVLNRNG